MYACEWVCGDDDIGGFREVIGVVHLTQVVEASASTTPRTKHPHQPKNQPNGSAEALAQARSPAVRVAKRRLLPQIHARWRHPEGENQRYRGRRTRARFWMFMAMVQVAGE